MNSATARTCLFLVLVFAALAPSARAAALSSPRPTNLADLGQADRLVASGRKSEGLALYRLVGESGANAGLRAAGWLRAGRLVGDGMDAENSYRRAVELAQAGEPAAEARLELGRMYFAQGSYRAADQALAAAQNKLEGTPYASDLLLFRARTAMALHVYDAAAVAYRELGRSRAYEQPALVGWGQALTASGQPAKAVPIFDRCAQSYPGGDYLSAALSGLARAGQQAHMADRAAAARARLAMAAPESFDALDLPAPAGSPAPAPARATMAAPATPRPATPHPAAPHPAAQRPAAQHPAAPRPAAPIQAKQAAHEPPAMHPAGPSIDVASPPVSMPAAAPSPAGSGFYLQMGLFSQRTNALSLLRRTAALGLNARLDSVRRGLSFEYQVHGRAIATRAEADAEAARLRAVNISIQVKQGSPPSGR